MIVSRHSAVPVSMRTQLCLVAPPPLYDHHHHSDRQRRLLNHCDSYSNRVVWTKLFSHVMDNQKVCKLKFRKRKAARNVTFCMKTERNASNKKVRVIAKCYWLLSSMELNPPTVLLWVFIFFFYLRKGNECQFLTLVHLIIVFFIEISNFSKKDI